jgi:hypothetical protein
MKLGFYKTKTFTMLLFVIILRFPDTQGIVTAQEVYPVLEFPQSGLDDADTYHGYTTRFFQDSEGNTLQISINWKNGRVVNLWADAANESISFTIRDSKGQPAELTWLSESALVNKAGLNRFVEYTLSAKSSVLDIGHFLLASMRKERDYQHFQHHLQPFGAEPYIEDEFKDLISNIDQLPEKVRRLHLSLLKAKDTDELRSRLVPRITFSKGEQISTVYINQVMFDGKNHLLLELSVDSKKASIEVTNDKISIRSNLDQPIQIRIKVGTDSPTLHPLRREDIFNNDFFRFYERVKLAHDNALNDSGIAGKDAIENEKILRFKRLDRQVKSMELMCSQEKLLAGVPNYATYFGRDMMMSALMLEPVLTSAMLEHVIASVLRKLTPNGEVSHEEGLGGQAMRENAAEYNKLLTTYFQQKSEKIENVADSILADAEKLLGNLQTVTENYRMVDDDFQLSVLTAVYLNRSDIPAERKHAFLQANSGEKEKTTRLTLLIRNLLFVTQISRGYVTHPAVENLVSFQKINEHHWHAGSWRDSGVGYANGRYAMDVNAIWVPKALKSIESIFADFSEIGISIDELWKVAPEIQNSGLIEYARDPQSLQKAIKTWNNAIRHFEIQLSVQEVQNLIRLKLEWFPEKDRAYWTNVITKSSADKEGIRFLALSLDERGRPIPVVNTDVATWLFLENLTEKILKDEIKDEDVIQRLRIFIVPYPVGLFIERVGPVATNDTYASPEVWAGFKRDIYHSPLTIWGREVNLLLLGLARQILAAYDAESQITNPKLLSYVRELHAILKKSLVAVDSSGLKHNELWSYRIEKDTLLPARYATTTDIQLWNLTDLAVQYLLDRIPKH